MSVGHIQLMMRGMQKEVFLTCFWLHERQHAEALLPILVTPDRTGVWDILTARKFTQSSDNHRPHKILQISIVRKEAYVQADLCFLKRRYTFSPEQTEMSSSARTNEEVGMRMAHYMVRTFVSFYLFL